MTILSVSIVAISAMTWLGLGRIAASLTKIDAFNGLTNRPAKVSSAVNYLIAGSDTREEIGRAHV